MKVFDVENIRKADAYTIENEPVQSIDLMERASKACFDWIAQFSDSQKKFMIFAGTGNNGGDGLALARMLLESGHKVHVYLLKYSSELSPDCNTNLQRLQEMEHKVHVIDSEKYFPEIKEGYIVVDALFGSGLNRPMEGICRKLVTVLNDSGNTIISIDIPSGLYADSPVDHKKDTVIHADYTLSFQFPKKAFFMSENESYVGNWFVLPIGLHPEYIEKTECKDYVVLEDYIKNMLQPRARFGHKGNYGHALIIAGSKGKVGASVLASKACLRSGAGLLTAHVPQVAYSIVQSTFPEAMVSVDSGMDFIVDAPDLNAYTSIAIGPGLDTDEETAKALRLLIQNSRLPLIIDADGLNILSSFKTWISFLPQGSILTPHPGEFRRLAGEWKDDFDKVQMQRNFSLKYNVYVVLKGANTSISTPEGYVFFNSTGNPGMATAGSGDVLTGIMAGIKAQGYSPLETCLLGVYLHGLSGDIAASGLGLHSLIASDIIEHLPDAFQTLYK
jgi:NAD(P)H-hydrate epimerase